jgi:hypothetical protein
MLAAVPIRADWDELAKVAPPRFDIVKRCLRRDTKRRTQSMGDVRVALEDVLAAGDSSPPARAAASAGRKPHHVLPWVVAGLCAAAAVATFLFETRKPKNAPVPMRLSVDLAGQNAIRRTPGPPPFSHPTAAYRVCRRLARALFIRRLDDAVR